LKLSLSDFISQSLKKFFQYSSENKLRLTKVSPSKIASDISKFEKQTDAANFYLEFFLLNYRLSNAHTDYKYLKRFISQITDYILNFSRHFGIIKILIIRKIPERFEKPSFKRLNWLVKFKLSYISLATSLTPR